jgi:hypothetical protein
MSLPALVVPDEPGLHLPRFAVIGMYDEQTSTFVKHVALLREEGSVSYGLEVRVFHMGPPLVVGARSQEQAGYDPTCPSHVAGWVNLTADEREGVIDWLAEVDKEDRPGGLRGIWRTYIVDPPECWHEDKKQVRLYRRFSCGGFVLACYRDGAGITLMEVPPPTAWPVVSLDEIARAYGSEVRGMGSLRRSLGLHGDGPWSILLAGYVMHAFNRPTDEIRTSPFVVTDPEFARFSRP